MATRKHPALIEAERDALADAVITLMYLLERENPREGYGDAVQLAMRRARKAIRDAGFKYP